VIFVVEKVALGQVFTEFFVCLVVLGGVMVIVLAIGSKVREFKPGQGQQIFKGNENL
jgi:hypothetical protein